MLFGCYRRDEAHDPETYTAAIAAVLAEYSQFVVDRVTDPRTGIATTCKFLPTVAELTDACKAERRWELSQSQPAPKRIHRFPSLDKPPIAQPNLFVHVGAPGYERLVESLKGRDEKRYRFQAGVKPGVWVPFPWWEEVRGLPSGHYSGAYDAQQHQGREHQSQHKKEHLGHVADEHGPADGKRQADQA